MEEEREEVGEKREERRKDNLNLVSVRALRIETSNTAVGDKPLMTKRYHPYTICPEKDLAPVAK